MKRYYIMLFLLLLFFGCTSVSPSPSPDDQILASKICPSIEDAFFIPNWEAVAGLAILASAAILAVLFMFSRFFGNEAGEAWVKIEIFELFTTIFITIIVIALLNASCSIKVGSLIAPPDVADLNIFEAAASILNGFSEDLIWCETFLHGFFIPLDYLTTTTLHQHPMGMGTVLHPTAGFGAVIKPALINAFQMIAIAFIVVRVELAILDFVTFAMLTYYLPLGILMRSFTPTRRIGGTLIGLTIGLVLMYPYLIILNGFTVYSMDPFTIDQATWDTLVGVVAAAWEPLDQFSEGSLSVTEPMGIFVFLKLFVTGIFGSIIGIYYSLVLRFAAVAFLLGIFFPALNTLILVTTIRYLTKAFGEEIDVTSLTRMI